MTPLRLPLHLCAVLLALFFLGCATLHAQPLSGRVSWVYDGDTLKVDGIGKVRLLGIDTPEREDSARDNYYVRQGVTVQRLRAIARLALRRAVALAKGRVVTLTSDGDGRDRYGRLLAYVHLPDGRLLNRLLLEEGLASVYRKFSYRLKDEFLAVEAGARQRGVGLWQRSPGGG
ncbi:MAG: thermonuclease family protein [Desulfuromonadales bacterium]|nr:thermonuclease family protein [Desulfuromonadales bacterium]MDT8423058.1 thermonuclease family protein [Desulfuromonadales bacterium]